MQQHSNDKEMESIRECLKELSLCNNLGLQQFSSDITVRYKYFIYTSVCCSMEIYKRKVVALRLYLFSVRMEIYLHQVGN